MKNQTYYAHTAGDDKTKWQLLLDHLTGTARIAEELAADAGLGAYAFPLGMLHDIGKYSLAFQRRLEGGEKVDHATAGAKEIVNLLKDVPPRDLIGGLLAYCIVGHHGGLPDCGSPFDTQEDGTLAARLKKSVENYDAYRDEIDLEFINQIPSRLPIRPHPQFAGFSIAFMLRMVYSALVDADFIETETFTNHGKKPRGEYASIPQLAERFNGFLARFANARNDLHRKRNEILSAAIGKAILPPGLFKMTVPTGGGKTFASMAFALNHAHAHGLKRIIYVIPYTSIIEQNAALFKESLGEANVLEHHSNFDWDSLRTRLDEEDADKNIGTKLRLAAENWDIPIVVTTNVQFFESLFANRSSKCRKLHNLARSVIIFDEAQMLPLEFLQPCMLAIHELTANYGATAVLCTATQPELGRFFPNPERITELAPDPAELYRFFKRVHIQSVGKLPDMDLLERLNAEKQVLCIVNTRRHALGLFDGLQGEGCFHLSTLMCPVHRRGIIAEIRARLDRGLACRVVSTQIMEAGIDVDFPVAYRAEAGLDSIIQAAGRVNREAKRDAGHLFVFEPDSDFVIRTPAYIRQTAEVCRMVFRGKDDPGALEVIAEYYNRLYGLKNSQAFDSRKILQYFELVGRQAWFKYESAAKDFKLIDERTQPVVIPYDAEAQKLLEYARDSETPWRFARRLQPYTVNIYSPEFNTLESGGAIDLYNEAYNVLNDLNLYHPITGLRLPAASGGNAIFVDLI